jgi:hypothetical protein
VIGDKYNKYKLKRLKDVYHNRHLCGKENFELFVKHKRLLYDGYAKNKTEKEDAYGKSS